MLFVTASRCAWSGSESIKSISLNLLMQSKLSLSVLFFKLNIDKLLTESIAVDLPATVVYLTSLESKVLIEKIEHEQINDFLYLLQVWSQINNRFINQRRTLSIKKRRNK